MIGILSDVQFDNNQQYWVITTSANPRIITNFHSMHYLFNSQTHHQVDIIMNQKMHLPSHIQAMLIHSKQPITVEIESRAKEERTKNANVCNILSMLNWFIECVRLIWWVGLKLGVAIRFVHSNGSQIQIYAYDFDVSHQWRLICI